MHDLEIKVIRIERAAVLKGLAGLARNFKKVIRVADALVNELAHKGEKWDPEKLNVWLFKPQVFAKGTKMTFPGLAKPQDRADSIAYLESLK